MYEVIVTFRRDLSERAVGRYSNTDEAQVVALLLSRMRQDQIIRAWVRQVRGAETSS
jgi:hypothetical protein